MTGLETALSVVQHTMIETGLMGWEDFARVTSTAPGRDRPGGRTRAARSRPANPPTSHSWTRLRAGPWTLLRWQPWAVTLRLPAGNCPAR